MELKYNSTAALSHGKPIPRLGFGTWRLAPGEETERGVAYALQVGYRHIDTAWQYGNEVSVGKAIKESGIPEAEIFVTTKLWNDNHGYEPALKAFEVSLRNLQLEMIDLYLIHFPSHPQLRRQTWQGMEAVLKTGQCRAIGVSNFTVPMLEEIYSYCTVPPAANQIELHPFMFQAQKDIIDFCQEKEIVIEAYRPLTKGARLNDERVTRIAAKYGKSSAQVLIRWSLEHGFVVIPKSSHPERIEENHNVFDFELNSEEMALLDSFETVTFMGSK